MSQWENVMAKHAKSFYLASLFFPSHLLPKVKALYALCRWLDDAVDEAPNREQALLSLGEISQDLHAENPQMVVNQMYRQQELDIGYIDDLIEGAKDDLGVVRLKTQSDLIRYSYKVAGTVGLAMSDLMGVSSRKARAHAVDLGIAMQITNICRDVKEDLERGRIYLPIQWFEEQGLTEEDFMQGNYKPEQVIAVTRRALHLADTYYLSASHAFQHIPWRSRGAIIIASTLYRGIGVKLLRQGGNPMKGRTYLSTFEKVFVVAGSLIKWAFSGLKKSKGTHDPQLHQPLQPWTQLRGFQG